MNALARTAHAKQLPVIWAMMRRALNEILRVPGAAIPGVLAPAIFMVGLNGVFGKIVNIPGFPSDHYIDWILPLSLLQGAGFAGAATGVNLARDIESGLFDRFLLAPISRISLLTGIVLSAALRVLLPTTFLLLLGFAIGLSWPGVFGLGTAAIFYVCFAAISACWGVALAMKFRSQQAAPLMQIGTFAAILCTTAYAPIALLTGWLKPVAQANPATYILQGIRQGFIEDFGWSHTWPAILAVLGLLLVMGSFALWQIRRFNH